MNTISQLTGKTGFLNGQQGLHGMEETILKALLKEGKEVSVIDNLFEEPEKLKSVVQCDNIVFSTTGFYADDLKKLIDVFRQLEYVPKVVIFATDKTAEALIYPAKEFKTK